MCDDLIKNETLKIEKVYVKDIIIKIMNYQIVKFEVLMMMNQIIKMNYTIRCRILQLKQI